MNTKSIVEEIALSSDLIRFVVVGDNNGNVVHIKQTTKQTMIDENQTRLLTVDMVVLRNLLKLYDDFVGKTTFAHFIREVVHVLVFFTDDFMFLVSCDKKLDRHTIADISDKIDSIIQSHIS